MNVHHFSSAFARQLSEYLAFKEKMGCYGRSRILYLKRFDAYCAARSFTTLNRAAVEGWVRAELERSAVYRSWMSYIRDFGRWMRTHENPDAYVLSSEWKSPFVRSQPYLFTRREIELFFVAAARFQARSPWRWQAVAFFTLMHSCGLRTGEARNLLVEHVHLDENHVEILWSKGNRSRRLPITGEVSEILAACDQEARAQFGPSRQAFFVSAAGTHVARSAVGTAFSRIWAEAGLPRPKQGARPRPYDFRHHFAYANIERWMMQGDDVTAMLPYLSRYMGHATFESTYYYVHTSPDFLNTYASITQASQAILPEVGFA